MAKRQERKTPEEKQAIIKAVDEARAKGATFGDALKTAGITDNTYYNWKRKGPKRKAAKPAPQLITLPLDVDMPLVIVMGKAGEVTAALNRLTAIRGA